jgi:hypothetical protein
MSMDNHGGMISTGEKYPPEISDNPTSTHLLAYQKELGK